MRPTTKFLTIFNTVALILTIAVNYFSNAGMLNGNSMKTISDRYANYFTPAGYAFSIWGLIYLGLTGFVCYWIIKRKDKKMQSVLTNVGWWFLISCLSNSFWVIAWLNDYLILSVILMVLLLFSLIAIINRTRMELDAHPLKEYVFIYWPFALYAGWITVALIANVSAMLTKVKWDGWGIPAQHWAVGMIVAAGLVNVIMVKSRNLREFAAVGIWGLIAIANNGQPDRGLIVYTCYGVSFCILSFIIVNGMKSNKGSIHSM
ncbi:MAG: tryptophan-rich sensory protein [Chryseobacterium sp.]|nr:MAG: tryptophan-rich sensory protein [Chryseobacterium sp.]